MADLAHLQAVAAQLAARVRDDDPDTNAAWLLAMLPDPADRFALHFVQAAATPTDRPWSELIAWTRGEQPEPQWADQVAAAYQAGRSAAAAAIRAGMRGGMPRALTGQSPRGGRPAISSYAEWAAQLALGATDTSDTGRREYWRNYRREQRARPREEAQTA